MTEPLPEMSSRPELSDLPAMPTAEPERARRSLRRRATMGVAAVALLGAGTITTVALAGGNSEGGAKSPKAAVLDLVQALEDEDVLGVLDIADPSERNVLVAAVKDVDSEAKRLKLLGEAFSLEGVPGIDLLVQGLELETEELESDLAVVHATAGFIRGSFDPKEFPIGETIGAVDAEGGAETLEFDDEDVDVFVATVERGGRWYVSLSYTVAEYARRAAGVELAEPGAAVRPEGFPTAQAAAQALVDRMVAMDLRGAVATAAPGEGDALARYAPLWLPGVEEAAGEARTEGLSLTIRDAAWDVKETGDRAVATLTAYTLEGTLPASGFSEDGSYEEYPDGSDVGLPRFDPALPTIIWVYVGDEPAYVVIPAGEPVPERIDSTPRTDVEDLPLGETNYADVGPDGVVVPGWGDDSEPTEPTVPAEPTDPAVPITFTITRSGACSTLTGPLVEKLESGTSIGSLLLIGFGGEKVGDGFRYCDAGARQLLGWFFSPVVGAAVNPPPVALVRIEGQWYVSPLGTAAAWAVGQLRGIATGDTGLDGPLAWWIYNTDRSGLESELSTMSRDDMGESCVAISEFDAEGAFVRVIDSPDPALVRACWNDEVYLDDASEDVPTSDGGYQVYPCDAVDPLCDESDSDSGYSATTAAPPPTTGG